MKRITLLILVLLSSLTGFSQVENFDDPTVVAPTGATWLLPTGSWLIFDNGVGSIDWTLNPQATYPANSGTKAAYMNRQNIGDGNTSQDYLVTPLLTVPQNPQLRFYTRTTVAGDQGTIFQVRAALASSDPTQISSYTILLEDWTENELNDNYDVYEEKIVEIPPTVGTSVYIAFVRVFTQPDGIGGDRWLIDDFKFIPRCLDPEALVATPFDDNANLSWTSAGPATQWEVHVLPADATFDATAGTPLVATTNTNFNVTATTQPTATPLLPLTEYIYYVRAVCENSPSDWVASEPFFTQASPPECGGNYVDSGGPDASYSLNEDSVITICPETSTDQVTVTFLTFATEDNYDGLYVHDGDSTAAPLIPSDNEDGNTQELETPGAYWGSEIPGPFTATSASGCLTFHFVSDTFVTDEGWTANVTCLPPPTCPKPSELTANFATHNSVELQWTANGPGTQFEIIAVPEGSPAPTAASIGIPATSNPFLYTDLAASTCFDFYVRAICAPDDISL